VQLQSIWYCQDWLDVFAVCALQGELSRFSNGAPLLLHAHRCRGGWRVFNRQIQPREPSFLHGYRPSISIPNTLSRVLGPANWSQQRNYAWVYHLNLSWPNINFAGVEVFATESQFFNILITPNTRLSNGKCLYGRGRHHSYQPLKLRATYRSHFLNAGLSAEEYVPLRWTQAVF